MKIAGNLYIGVDIGGTKISAGLVDNRGRILSSRKCPTPAAGGGSRIFQQTRSLIAQLLAGQQLKPNQIRGIAIGIPGVVRPNHRDILITPNVSLANYPLARNLELIFRTKVILGNDVNFGLLGEQWLGIAKEAQNIVGIFPGTGVGGAIIIREELVLGAQGAAGELGHMILDFNSPKESAGLCGTLEALVSRRAIERELKEAIQKGKKTIITRMCGRRPRAIKSSVIAQALAKKDPLTLNVMRDVCTVLGKACISIRHILNPDMIILGGGLIEACGDYIVPEVRKISARDPFFKGIDACRIEQSLLGDDAVILGAVALLKRVLGEKAAAGGVCYPALRVGKNRDVLIDGKAIKRNVYIRADGRMKKLNGASALPQLGISLLKKVCRKNPQVLIVGARKAVQMSKYDRRFLDKKKIAYCLLNVKKAVGAYNAFKDRKAVLLFLNKSA